MPAIEVISFSVLGVLVIVFVVWLLVGGLRFLLAWLRFPFMVEERLRAQEALLRKIAPQPRSDWDTPSPASLPDTAPESEG